MLRIPALATTLAVVACGLTGCALLEDVGDGDLDDALELVSEDATFVTFTHRQAAAERLGIDDVATGGGEAEVSRYLETLVEGDLAGSTRFGAYLTAMTENAAFSELDIVWEATASTEGESLGRVYKMNDELDLDEVGDDLVDAGYQEEEISGHRHFFVEDQATDLESDGTIGGYPGYEMLEVVVVPDEHVMLIGGTKEIVEAAVEVLEDDADSAIDSGGFDDVTDGADDPELAVLARDAECVVGGGEVTPEMGEAAGLEGLGTPNATGFFVSGDDVETSSALAFADDDAAEADLEAREDYLADGVLLRTREPIADLAEWDMERDGNVIRIDYAYDDPRMAREAALSSDGFHACNPG